MLRKASLPLSHLLILIVLHYIGHNVTKESCEYDQKISKWSMCKKFKPKELYEESTGCNLPVSRKITISMLLSLICLIHYVRSSVLQLSCCGVLCGKNAVVGNPAVDRGWYAVAGWGGAGDKLPGDHSVWQGRPAHPKPVFKNKVCKLEFSLFTTYWSKRSFSTFTRFIAFYPKHKW